MEAINLIIKKLKKDKEIRAAEIVKATGFSRTYINKIFQQLEEEGILVLVGKANQARYVAAEKSAVAKAKKGLLSIRRILKNQNLSEDIVFDEIRKETGIFIGLPKNISSLVNYAFTKMLNNAIEHSHSPKITVRMEREKGTVSFEVVDHGVGIFNNILKKKHLKNELEAIQDLLKGKQTTAPTGHSGEGIFFTSKAADMLIIQSSRKKLIFNNSLEDVFVKNSKNTLGTRVSFSVSAASTKNLKKIFDAYTDDSFEFSKTRVKVKLYKIDTEYISRSQGRRIMAGLDKFKTIVLDFKEVETVGQGFVDEVFRVWQAQQPHAKIISLNANENVNFMLKRY